LDVLITGLNRSGTSALANLLVRTLDLSLLDDPEEVIDPSVATYGIETIRQLTRSWSLVDVVKAPRATEVLAAIEDIFDPKVVHVVRDPRDVYASIMEKVRVGRRTRMLDNDRFDGPVGTPARGVAAAARTYHEAQLDHVRSSGSRGSILRYDHFYRDRASVVSGLANQLYPERSARSLGSAELEMQWGPSVNKAGAAVRGPGRWVGELGAASESDFDDAVAAYRQVAALCGCTSCANEYGGPIASAS
jgi:hypothetical protein